MLVVSLLCTLLASTIFPRYLIYLLYPYLDHESIDASPHTANCAVLQLIAVAGLPYFLVCSSGDLRQQRIAQRQRVKGMVPRACWLNQIGYAYL
jgi:hypothetical protein